MVKLPDTRDSPCTTWGARCPEPYVVQGKIVCRKNKFMHYVYILLLSNKQLYTGRTDDLRRRVQEHENGKVAATRYRRPLKLIFYETFLSKEDAVRRERYLKTSKGKSTLNLMLRDSLKIL